MFGSPFISALSGIQAAATKLSVSANNIANANSTTKFEDGEVVNEVFTPDAVQQTALETGGVRTEIVKVSADPLLVFDPDNPVADSEGFVEIPAVELSSEAVNQIVAKNEFKANLATIERAKDLDEALLDILS